MAIKICTVWVTSLGGVFVEHPQVFPNEAVAMDRIHSEITDPNTGRIKNFYIKTFDGEMVGISSLDHYYLISPEEAEAMTGKIKEENENS